MLQRLHGDTTDDADIGTSTMNVGDVAMAARDLGEAAVLYREALAMLVRLHGGDDDYNIALAVRKLAEVVGAQGDVAESVRQLRVSLEMFKRLYRDSASASTSTSTSASGSGADHPQFALCMRALAHALGKQGSMAESTRLHRESLAMLLRLHGRADDEWPRRDAAAAGGPARVGAPAHRRARDDGAAAVWQRVARDGDRHGATSPTGCCCTTTCASGCACGGSRSRCTAASSVRTRRTRTSSRG